MKKKIVEDDIWIESEDARKCQYSYHVKSLLKMYSNLGTNISHFRFHNDLDNDWENIEEDDIKYLNFVIEVKQGSEVVPFILEKENVKYSKIIPKPNTKLIEEMKAQWSKNTNNTANQVNELFEDYIQYAYDKVSAGKITLDQLKTFLNEFRIKLTS